MYELVMKNFILIFTLMTSVSGAITATNNIQEMADSEQGLSFYKPNYALLGTDPILEAKMQFSFKYRFVEEGAFERWWSAPANQLFFAYTQKMFWDLEEDSAPYPNNYLDSYFSPELFWLKREMASSIWDSQFDFQVGFQHESNGRDSIFGRTWDRRYAQPFWTFGETRSYQFVATPKIWVPVNVGDEMDDIADYFGYGELWLKWGRHDGVLLETMLRKGTADWYGAVELNASYPIRPLNIFLYGQIFYGYGETLRLYNEETTTYRIGFALSR